MTTRLFFLLLCFVFLNSCNTKFNVSDNPAPIPECDKPERVRVALILGGGGTKGMAHVGVLEELEKAQIPIDIIVGCSAGSIVGALYADCPDVSNLKKIFSPLKVWDILDVNAWRWRYGLVQGNSLRQFLCKNLSCRRFEELKIPLYVVATDLLQGDLACFSTGLIIPAVHASSAVPFVFSPVVHHERFLVDGGVVDPVPVQVAKRLEAEVILAVDLSQMLPKTCPTHLFGIASRAAEIKFLLQSESCIKDADILIRPELNGMGMFDDKDLEKVYQAGRLAAEKAIPELIALLKEKGILCEDKETEADTSQALVD